MIEGRDFLCIRKLNELPNNSDFGGGGSGWSRVGRVRVKMRQVQTLIEFVGLPHFKVFVKEEEQHNLESLTQPYQ